MRIREAKKHTDPTNPDADPGGPNTYGSYESGCGSGRPKNIRILRIRMRIREAQKHTDPTNPDADQQRCFLVWHFKSNPSKLNLTCFYRIGKNWPPVLVVAPWRPVGPGQSGRFLGSLVGCPAPEEEKIFIRKIHKNQKKRKKILEEFTRIKREKNIK